jgi:hypothetical protein
LTENKTNLTGGLVLHPPIRGWHRILSLREQVRSHTQPISFKGEVDKRSGSSRDGSVYMHHRDGSATYSPEEETYVQRKPSDPDSKIPAPTEEEIVEEAKEVKREHREYLASPVRYWNGVRTVPRRNNLAWLFPMYFFFFPFPCGLTTNTTFSCDCADHYCSVYDDDYPSYDDYGDEYEPDYGEYGYYGFNFEEGEEEEDYTDDDRSSSGADEQEPIAAQEDDKTMIRIIDIAHLPSVQEPQVDVKREIEEEPRDGSALAHPASLKPETEGIPGSSFVSNPTTSGSAEPVATGSGTGEQTSRTSGVGPDVQTEGKRVSDPRPH